MARQAPRHRAISGESGVSRHPPLSPGGGPRAKQLVTIFDEAERAADALAEQLR